MEPANTSKYVKNCMLDILCTSEFDDQLMEACVISCCALRKNKLYVSASSSGVGNRSAATTADTTATTVIVIPLEIFDRSGM